MIPFFSFGQSVSPPMPPPPPPGLPIDGFTGLFLVIGMFFGAKKILKDSSS